MVPVLSGEMEEGSADMMQNLTNGNFTYCSCAAQCRVANLSSTNISCDCQWAIPPPLLKYSPYIAAIEAGYFIIAFFWNLFIIISFIARRKLLKEPASVYLFNLAWTDLLLAIFIIFQCFIAEVSEGFIIGHTDVIRCWICEFLGFMIMFLMASTLHTLAVLSFDRFFLLVKPLSYQNYFTWRRALIIVAAIWVLSFCIAIPPIFGVGEYAFSQAIANCHPQWAGTSYTGIRNLNYIILVGVEALIPIAFLTFTNMWTYKIVTGVLRSRLQRQRSFANKFSPKTQQVKNSESDHTRQQLQLVKVFGALFVAHIVCWLPVLSVLVVANIIGPEKIPLEVFLVGWLFYLTNPVAHPMLETFFIKDLRTRVKRVQKSMKTTLRKVGSIGQTLVQKSVSQGSSIRGKDQESEQNVSQRNGVGKLTLTSKCSANSVSMPQYSPRSPGESEPPKAHVSVVKFTVLEGQDAQDGGRLRKNGYRGKGTLPTISHPENTHNTHLETDTPNPDQKTVLLRDSNGHYQAYLTTII